MAGEDTNRVCLKNYEFTPKAFDLIQDIDRSFKTCGKITDSQYKRTDDYEEITETNACGMKHVQRLHAGNYFRRRFTELYLEPVKSSRGKVDGYVGFQIDSNVMERKDELASVKGRFEFYLKEDKNIPLFGKDLSVFLLDGLSNYLIELPYDEGSEGFTANRSLQTPSSIEDLHNALLKTHFPYPGLRVVE